MTPIYPWIQPRLKLVFITEAINDSLFHLSQLELGFSVTSWSELTRI